MILFFNGKLEADKKSIVSVGCDSCIENNKVVFVLLLDKLSFVH